MGADILAHLRLKALAEIYVGTHGSPNRRLIAQLGNLHAIVNRRVGSTRTRRADASHVGGIGQTAQYVDVLHLHDRLRGVLVPEHDILGIVVLFEIAVDLLDLLQRIERRVPLLVPHGHLGDEHIGAGRTQTGAGIVGGTRLRSQRSDRLQILDHLSTGFGGIHARQHLNPVQDFVIGHVVEIERHVSEKARQRIIIKCTKGFGLAQQLMILLVAEHLVLVGALDTRNGEIAALHAEIALLPYGRTETGHGGRDIHTRVERTRRAVCDIGDALRGEHILIGIDRFDRNIAAVDHGLALREFAEEIFGRRQG